MDNLEIERLNAELQAEVDRLKREDKESGVDILVMTEKQYGLAKALLKYGISKNPLSHKMKQGLIIWDTELPLWDYLCELALDDEIDELKWIGMAAVLELGKIARRHNLGNLR